jgi:molybdopterin-guanine dinucleotide biosynthesis protein A
VQEEPAFSGPAAAIATAVEALDDAAVDGAPEGMLVLAGDLPYAGAAAARLASAVQADTGDAVVFRTGDRPQWLAGAYRASALRDAVRDLGDALTGASCRALLGGLEIAWLADDDGITADVDTPADLARVRAAFEEEP